MKNEKDLLLTLVKLYEKQEGIKIECQIKKEEKK